MRLRRFDIKAQAENERLLALCGSVGGRAGNAAGYRGGDADMAGAGGCCIGFAVVDPTEDPSPMSTTLWLGAPTLVGRAGSAAAAALGDPRMPLVRGDPTPE